MKNLPKKIYLNFGDAFIGDADYSSTDFKDLVEVSWCEERLDEYDHCYIDDSEGERLAKENESLKSQLAQKEKLIKKHKRLAGRWEQIALELQEENERLRNEKEEILKEILEEIPRVKEVYGGLEYPEELVEQVFAKYGVSLPLEGD